MGTFHVVVLLRAAKKRTKIYNARAQPLLCLLDLSSCEVLVAVDVVMVSSRLKLENTTYLKHNFSRWRNIPSYPRFNLHTEHEGSHIISEFVILEDGFGLDSGMNDLSIVLRKRYRLWILEDRKADRRVGRQSVSHSVGQNDREIDKP